jgi:PAS domain S-box-containing protein
VATTAVAGALTAALWPANAGGIAALYYLAVTASAIYGNRTAAMLAIALSILSLNYSFIPPYHEFSRTIDAVYVLTAFAGVSLVIVLLIEKLRSRETTMRETENLFSRAFHANPSGLAISRASDGQYVEMNDAFGGIVGRTREETIGRTAIELGLVSPEQREAYVAELRDRGGFRDRLFVFTNHAGLQQRVLATSERVSFQGQPHFVGIFSDITERWHAVEALQQQALLIANAQRIGRMGSWSLNLRSGHVVWPEATCLLFGITSAEFDGTFEQFRRFILPEDLPVYDAASNRVSPSDPAFEAEYRIRRPDGMVRWMYSRGSSEFDAAGTPTSRVGMVMDITEQRTARDQLAENAALLRTAGRVARLGGWTLSLPERTLIWSDENCAIHDVPPGYKPTFQEGVGYYPPDYQAEVNRHVDACERDGTPYDFELPKLTATGRRIWVRSIGEAVRDADGRIVRLHGAFQDISDRRNAEEALRQSEADFRMLAEAMPQIVWMTRPDGWNTYLNQRWVDYTGISLEDSYGAGWNTPLHLDDRQRAWDVWQQAMAGGDYNLECRLRRADGSYRWMLVRGSPVRDAAGQLTKWIGTSTDIDDLKQAQEVALNAERVQRELAVELEAERARLVAAQAVARVGSWEADLSTRGVIWSAETYRIFEASPDGVPPTQLFLRRIHPDDRAAMEEAFSRSLGQHSPSAIEHRLLMPDGRITFVEERWEVVRDEQGHPVRATGTCQDITERRRALDAIRVQAQMLDQIGQAVIATDTGGRVTYANRFAGELYQWAPGEMVGRIVTEVTGSQATREQSVESATRLQRGETWSGEFQVQRRDGRAFPAHVIESPVLNDRGGLSGIIGISIDISARKHAEAEIRQKDTLIRIASRVTRTGGWALELPDHRVFWSDEVFDILERPRGIVPSLAEALTMYIDPWGEKVAEALVACARDGTPIDLEAEVLTTSGVRKWVRVSAEAERQPDGSIHRVQGAFQDISERKLLEQQYLRAQRMESIGTLAGGIAHDLNNVLAPIMMSIGLLQDGEHDEDRLQILATIETSARRGANMISRVLSFARGVEGQRVEVQLAPLVRDLAKIIEDTFPKNIQICERLEDGLWAVQADPTQLHQVLLNLCVNARDAMPAGGRITISAENVLVDEHFAAVNIEAEPGPYVRIDVHDTGTGVPREILGRIFDPFFTTKAVGKGTGLGLATSLAIVKSHRGFIRVDSDPGAGARFRIFVPAGSTSAPPPQVAADAPALLPRGKGEMVLVIDDEEPIRRIARRILEAFGYRVLLAADGAEAVALYAKHQHEVAVVLTDMMMPGMDGRATIQALLQLNPEALIVAASGFLGNDQLSGAAAPIVKHFLAKPYTAETLLSAISTVLSSPS